MDIKSSFKRRYQRFSGSMSSVVNNDDLKVLIALLTQAFQAPTKSQIVITSRNNNRNKHCCDACNRDAAPKEVGRRACVLSHVCKSFYRDSTSSPCGCQL